MNNKQPSAKETTNENYCRRCNDYISYGVCYSCLDKSLADQKAKMKKLIWYEDKTIGTKPNEKDHKIIVIKKIDWDEFIERV